MKTVSNILPTGNYLLAREILKRLSDFMSKHLPESTISQGKINLETARIYLQEQLVDAAYENLIHALIQYTGNLTPENIEEISDSFVEAAISLNNSEKHTYAIIVLIKLKEIYPIVEENPRLGEIDGLIGDILIIMKNYREAAKYHKQSLKIYLKCYDPADIHVARVCHRLNLVYFKLGVLGQSVVFFKKLRTVQRKLFGKEDMKVAESYQAIALCEQSTDCLQDMPAKEMDKLLY